MSPDSSCTHVALDSHRGTCPAANRLIQCKTRRCAQRRLRGSGRRYEFLPPRLPCQPAHQRGVLSRQRTFAQDAVDVADNLSEREGHAGKAAEQGVKLRHHHGSCHAFTGDVTQKEEELPIGGDQVAVVAADGADGAK